MKDFDITKAKQGHPVIRRDGRAVRIVCFDRKCDDGYPIVALIEDEDGEEQIQTYMADGRIYADQCISSGDLMLKAQKGAGWINIYKSSQNVFCDGVFDSKDEAMKSISDYEKCIDTVRIEWEE